MCIDRCIDHQSYLDYHEIDRLVKQNVNKCTKIQVFLYRATECVINCLNLKFRLALLAYLSKSRILNE
jgi:hypothetical protein